MIYIIRYMICTVGTIFFLLCLAPFLLYLPAVQEKVKSFITEISAEQLDMEVSIKSVMLRYPLDIELRETLVLTPQKDTLLECGALVLDISFRRIFFKEIEIKELSFEKAMLNFSDSASTLNLKVNVDELKLSARPVNLGSEIVDLPDILLRGGDVSLRLVDTPADTTKTSNPLKWAFRVHNIVLDNIAFKMETAPYPMFLSTKVGYASICDGAVDLGKHSVYLNSADIKGAFCKYLYSPVLTQSKPNVKQEVPESSFPWTINADTISVADADITYGKLRYTPKMCFDPDYIAVSGLNLQASSLYNRGGDIKVKLEELAFKERSGLKITHTEGVFSMDSLQIRLQGLKINTYNSNISGNIFAETSAISGYPSAAVSTKLKAAISLSDISYFYPPLTQTISLLPTRRIDLSTSLGGTLSDINLASLSVSIPNYAALSAKGLLAGFAGDKTRSARITLDGHVKDGSIVHDFISSPSDTTFSIPSGITLDGTAMLQGDRASLRLAAETVGANISVSGFADMADESYDLLLGITSLPLDSIMPNVGLGLLSCSVNASGEKFNLLKDGARANLNMRIDTLDYNGYRYNGITVMVDELNGEYAGTLKSTAVAAPLDLTFSGVLREAEQSVRLAGNIGLINLQKLNFSEDYTAVKTYLDITASADSANNYSVSGGLKQTDVFMYGVKRTLPVLDIGFISDSIDIKAFVNAENLSVKFSSQIPLSQFTSRLDSTISMVAAQIDSADIDARAVHNLLPPLNLSISVGRNSLIRTILKRNNIMFESADLKFMSGQDSPISLSGAVVGLSYGSVAIDTLSVALRQDSSILNYNLSLNSSLDNSEQRESISFYGYSLGNKINLNYIQKDKTGKTGFLFGGDILMYRDKIRFAMNLLDPIIGYSVCTVNADNYIDYHFDKHVEADLKISSTNGERYLVLYSPENSDGKKLSLKMASLDLSFINTLWPLAPVIGGFISSDLTFAYSSGHISASGNVGIDSLSYNKNLVGNVNLNMGYTAVSDNSEQANIALNIDGKKVMTLDGIHSAKGGDNSLKLNLKLDAFPLTAVNPFLPSDYASLKGVLNGDMGVNGTLDDIKLDGYIQFAGVELTVPAIGTTFNLSEERIAVADNVITMKNFGLSGPNKQPVNINGTVSLGNIKETLADIYLVKNNISISAKNFQLINVKKNNKTQIYGKAFADINISAKGALNAMKLNGDIALLNGTEITYSMRDGGMEEQENVSSLVTFESFNDTLDIDEVRPIQKLPWGMDMSVNVIIGQAVKMAVNLTADGRSGINLQGGGNLMYTMNLLGDTRFTGRYNISNGTVRYSPPIISTKIFNITSGSYVDWNGDIADPSLNITAENKVRSSIVENDKNVLVNFWVIIAIKNTLENLSVQFDLKAPEDMTISNELAAMSADQRSEQALSMLLYNSYTGPSNTQTKFDANTALNSFLQKELNQWARNNLKNVDLTFGVDSYKNKAGASGTDYSYELSKSLFNDRFKVIVGGSYNNEIPADKVAQTIIGDVTLEYQLDKRDNMLIKIFRNSQNDILEGTVVEYGAGFAVRKQVLKLKELFEVTGRKERVEKKRAEKKEIKKQ